jgi:hypothetical protein
MQRNLLESSHHQSLGDNKAALYGRHGAATYVTTAAMCQTVTAIEHVALNAGSMQSLCRCWLDASLQLHTEMRMPTACKVQEHNTSSQEE